MSKGIVVNKIKLNTAKIRFYDRASIRALETTMDQIKANIGQRAVVPREHGDLEKSVEIKRNHIFGDKRDISIIYDTPYARRLYYHPEYDFNRAVNGNAQGKWLEYYFDGEGADYIVEVFKYFMKKEAKL